MPRLAAPLALAVAASALVAVPTADAATAPPSVTTTDAGGRSLHQMLGAHPGRTLREGTPHQAGLLASYADRVVTDAAAGVDQGLYPSESVITGRHGVVAEQGAAGMALEYADRDGTELPQDQQIPATESTIYDLASLSKLFTSVVAVQQLQAGRLQLDRTVASYLPAFGNHGKDTITVRQLLTHTSGLRPDPEPGLWTYDTMAQRRAAILTETPAAAPGSTYTYSDLNMMSLQLLLEKVTGTPLETLVHDGITGPLGMRDTGYNPPASEKRRIAATEFEDGSYDSGETPGPDRGLVWGQVHDENAWALGGVSGHAGVFSTAHDLAILAQTMLNGGQYGRTRILQQRWVEALMTNENSEFPGDSHGLGFELHQYFYMGAMATPFTAGHTGYTGTSFVVDPTTDSFAILLTNRVHPNRDGASTNPARRAVTGDMARAVAVRPVAGKDAWFAGFADATTATLSTTVDLPAGRPASLTWASWYDTEPDADTFSLQASTDGGATWTPVPFRLDGRGVHVDTKGTVSGYEGRQWLRASADLSSLSGPVRLRWVSTTDTLQHGRGVYVDRVQVRSGRRLVLDGEHSPGRLVGDGWTRARD
ncbi:serine hydrolase [Marmoricola endophyticus]|uniref:Serine hydrolase n=1 Tax=Marmoricola endophyticus TaxID=2040280 RepID=A0A917EZI5_9ACTN|nr:serine hydrolase [Marmoricola endophyticus]GGF33827.1 serine hydrolase [Marmoricola endophyticus]